MIYQLLFVLFLVGVIGYLWTELQIVKEKLEEAEDFCSELDPVEVGE